MYITLSVPNYKRIEFSPPFFLSSFFSILRSIPRWIVSRAIDNFAVQSLLKLLERNNLPVCQFHTRPNGILTCLSGNKNYQEGKKEEKRGAFSSNYVFEDGMQKLTIFCSSRPSRCDLFDDREIAIGDFLFLAEKWIIYVIYKMLRRSRGEEFKRWS